MDWVMSTSCNTIVKYSSHKVFINSHIVNSCLHNMDYNTVDSCLDSMERGQRAVQKVAGTRMLHDLCPRVASQLAEPIVAEDDWSNLHLGVRYEEIAI